MTNLNLHRHDIYRIEMNLINTIPVTRKHRACRHSFPSRVRSPFRVVLCLRKQAEIQGVPQISKCRLSLSDALLRQYCVELNRYKNDFRHAFMAPGARENRDVRLLRN